MMSSTGASFFDSLTPAKETTALFKTTTLQDSNNFPSTSVIQAHSDLALPAAPESEKAEIKLSHYSIYEDYLPEWQMLSESYNQQKLDLHSRIKQQLDGLDELENRFEKTSMDFYQKMETAYIHSTEDLTEWKEELDIERLAFDREKDRMKLIRKCQDDKIKLNVGGQLFETSLSTLQKDPNSRLATMFTGHGCITPDENDGSYFIDRDSTQFRLVLNYLRDLKVPSSIQDDPKIMDELMQEARHYNITGLMNLAMAEDTTKVFSN